MEELVVVAEIIAERGKMVDGGVALAKGGWERHKKKLAGKRSAMAERVK